jgi:cell division protein ZapA
MATQKIKINIAGRYYPVKIEEGEEEVIRRIEQDINRKINEYVRNYNTNNILDIINLILFDCSFKLHQAKNSGEKEKLISKLIEIEDILK